MKRLSLALVLLPVAVFAIDPSEEIADPALQERYLRITNEVRCLVCQNQTVADSTAPLAADLRREIRRMVEEGQSESEIRTFLVDRYGDFVLYRPRFGGLGALLWLAPAILLLIGGITYYRVLARRSQLPSDQDAPLEKG